MMDVVESALSAAMQGASPEDLDAYVSQAVRVQAWPLEIGRAAPRWAGERMVLLCDGRCLAAGVGELGAYELDKDGEWVEADDFDPDDATLEQAVDWLAWRR